MTRARLLWLSLTLLLSLVLSAHAQSSITLTSGTVTYHGTTPSERWSGQAPLQSLTLTPGPDGLALSATVEPSQFSSGNFIRDANARFVVFESNTYPVATLSGTLPLTGELLSLESSAPISRTFQGELNLHGVTRALSFPVTLERLGDSVSAKASFPLKLSDYSMKRPSLFGLLVDDALSVDVALTVTLASP